MKNRMAKLAAAREKQRTAYAMAVDGKTYQTISEELGYYSRSSAFKAVKRYIDRYIEPENIEKARILFIEQMKKLQETFTTRINAGSAKEINGLFQAIDRQTKLMGLDIDRLDVTSGGQPLKPFRIIDPKEEDQGDKDE